jgi:type VI protein secretion system component VasF
VKQLQKQLEQLQEALTARNPTSVAALVHAARPSLQETEQVREMQATIDSLKHRVRAKVGEIDSEGRCGFNSFGLCRF